MLCNFYYYSNLEAVVEIEESIAAVTDQGLDLLEEKGEGSYIFEN